MLRRVAALLRRMPSPLAAARTPRILPTVPRTTTRAHALSLSICAGCASRALHSSSLTCAPAAASSEYESAFAAAPVSAAAPPCWPPSVDTIFQLSSGLGGAGAHTDSNDGAHSSRAPSAVGVAIIRVSGPLALPLLLTLTRRSKALEPRRATRVNLYQPDVSDAHSMRHFDVARGVLDSAAAAAAAPTAVTPLLLDTGILALYFPSPNSFTGEDVVELHVHGTPLLVHNTFDAIERINRRLVQQIVDPHASASSDETALDDSDDAPPADDMDSHSLARTSSMLSFPPLLRLATPGEFTRRAFHSGKLDLTQVEALGDLLSAQTDRQRDQALLQMRGALGALYTQWRLDLLNALAYVEAILDFSEDEQDVGEAEVLANVLPKVQAVAASLRAHLADARRGELVRGGIGIVIAGAPNAGKSTLLNALSRRNVAIVSPVPGTTRDIVENQLNIAGWACVIADTAGLRQLGGSTQLAGSGATAASDVAGDAAASSLPPISELSGHDLIEAEGMRRTHDRLRSSDIKLVLLDASALVRDPQHCFDPQVINMIDERSVVVWTKADLLPQVPSDAPKETEVAAPSAAATGRAKLRASQQFYERTRDAFTPEQLSHFHTVLGTCPAFQLVSQRSAGSMVFLACQPPATASAARGGADASTAAESHRGVQQLLSVLERQIQRTVGLDGAPKERPDAATSASAAPQSGPLPLITRARHRVHVSACCTLLDLFEQYLARGDLVLAAEQLRLATREIGRITGRVDVEELLDVIFADFCIGK